MRFRKTVDLWDSKNITRILDGSLRLQTGQWVRCGSDKLSRFVRLLPCGTIHAAHWNGSGAARQSRFTDLRGIYNAKGQLAVTAESLGGSIPDGSSVA